MKHLFVSLCFVSLVFSCGCSSLVMRTYEIDSNPQGLRVSVNNIDQGVTPCEFSCNAKAIPREIVVEAPTKQELRNHEKEKGKIVSIWQTVAKSKTIRPNVDGSGKVFFQFISSEYDVPKTDEEREWVRQAIQDDVDRLKAEKEEKRKILDVFINAQKTDR